MTTPIIPDYECVQQVLTFNGRTASEALRKLATYCEQREASRAILVIEDSHVGVDYHPDVQVEKAWAVTIVAQVIHKTLADLNQPL